MSEALPPQVYIEQAIEYTGFKRSVVEYLWDEFIDIEVEGTFFEYLAEQLGVASFVIAASNGLSINGCLAAYDHGASIMSEEGPNIDNLEAIIDEIEIEGLPNTEDDSEG